LSGYGGVYQAH
jgi:hypothetical protein